MLICISKASESSFSFATKELNIPAVVVDNNKLYTVKMNLINNENNLMFVLAQATELPLFEQRFETIEDNMSRQQVINLLGIPEKIKNLEIKAGAFCSEPSLDVGSSFEQWEYSVDSTSQGPSGYVVWFSKVDNTSEWKVVGKINGFSCI
jgi:hypothetical protein